MTGEDGDGGGTPVCPRCGGGLIEREVLEHTPCGHPGPRAEFTSETGLRCTDCGGTGEATFEVMGALYQCVDCGTRYDAPAADVEQPSVSAPRVSDDEYSSMLESIRERGARTGRGKVLNTVLVLALITSGIGSAVAVGPMISDDSDTRTWTTYDSIVVFRNDDLQPYYRTDTMRAVDRVFIEENVPVTQGVIPAIGNQPVAEDGEFCTYLREVQYENPDIFEYALHGYTHERLTDFHNGSEFGGLAYERQLERVSRGKRIMTECTGEVPSTFIPPMDTYDNQTVRALRAQNISLVSGGGWFTKEYYNETGVFERRGIRHISNSQSFVENWTTNEFHSEAELERSFDRTVANGSIYVQMLHYPQFNTSEKRDRLRSLIDYMKASGDVKFMTLGELDRRFEEDTIRRTEDGWRVYESTDEEPDLVDRIPYGDRTWNTAREIGLAMRRIAEDAWPFEETG